MLAFLPHTIEIILQAQLSHLNLETKLNEPSLVLKSNHIHYVSYPKLVPNRIALIA